MLETAMILARTRLHTQVLFCGFNLEEFNMIGSTHFARKIKTSKAEVQAMVSLEMVGYTDGRPGSQEFLVGLSWFYPDRGSFIAMVGNWNSNSLLKQFSRQFRRVRGLPVETLSVPGNGSLLPQVRLSDHSPFWDLDYPALLITDTPFFRNPHYHGRSDTLKPLDLEFMAKVG